MRCILAFHAISSTHTPLAANAPFIYAAVDDAMELSILLTKARLSWRDILSPRHVLGLPAA